MAHVGLSPHIGAREWSKYDNTRVDLGNRRTRDGLLLAVSAQVGKMGDKWVIYVWQGSNIDLLNYTDVGWTLKGEAQAFLDKRETWKHRVLCSGKDCKFTPYRADHREPCTLATFGQDASSES